MTILAIESSCDETSAALMREGELLSHITANQKVHAQYGGVVPELASRAHLSHIVAVVEQALSSAKISKAELSAIAFTQGPGLQGALLVGAYFAKAMAVALNKPLIGVNHIQAHILAHFIEPPKPDFPFICLTVSGGHTQLVWVESPLSMKLLGQTLDDAAGEAFDKTAKMLSLPYPGGPLIDKYAQSGDPRAFRFAKGKVQGYDFSFSGLKTSILYTLRDKTQENPDFLNQNLAHVCASAQMAIVESLVEKLVLAAKDFKAKDIAIAGGVSANSALRFEVQKICSQNGWRCFVPKLEYCTDNAAMIAMAATFMFKESVFCDIDAQTLPGLRAFDAILK
jgi:N6-L-threonylcarbamoyladenine synthase